MSLKPLKKDFSASLLGERVDAHARSYVRGEYTTRPEHMPPEHQSYAEWSPHRFIQWAKKIGSATAMLVEKILTTRPYPEQEYRACLGIIRLGRDYEPARVEAAAQRAIKFNACSYRSMKAILNFGLDRQRESGDHPTQETAPTSEHPRTRILPMIYKEEKTMLNQQTMSILHSLRLTGMARSFEERLTDPEYAELSHAEFVGLLVQDEKTYRDNRRLRRLLKKAKLRQEAALEDIDYGASRGLSQQVILDLGIVNK